jgi:hypothetical protein
MSNTRFGIDKVKPPIKSDEKDLPNGLPAYPLSAEFRSRPGSLLTKPL